MIQRIVQSVFLLAFVALLFFAADLVAIKVPVDVFLRLSPFAAISAMVAGRTIIAGMMVSFLLLGATLTFGRFFCAYVCPMGTTLDLVDWLTLRRIKRKGIRKYKNLQNFKYYILGFLVVSSIFSLTLVHAFDPIALATRIYAFLVYPLGVLLANLFLDAIRPLAVRLNWVGLSLVRFPQPVFSTNLITLLIFVGIAALNIIQPRFWCRNLCPLGALLSLVSRFGFLKRTVQEGCTHCQRCQNLCPMGAIKEDPYRTNVQECIQCRTCVLVCPVDVVSFRPVSPLDFDSDTYRPEANFSRRAFIAAAASGAAASFLAYSHPTRALHNPRLIRPPGAIPEELFLDTCIRCGSCMNVCITNTLQPSLMEGGLRGIWTPRLVQRLAPCEATCNLCGQVCPTQAIRSLPRPEKEVAKIGTASIDHRRCLAWEHDRLCLICDEQCPYDAIELKEVEGLKRPFVYEHKCSGCGMCEAKCPVEGESAIVVLPIGEIRLKTGSYIAEAKRLNLDIKLVEKATIPSGVEMMELTDQDLGLDPENLPPLPPGFISDEEIEKMKESSR
ncbi:MAG: 4Fe-4S binding protein [bacterium]